MIAVDTNVLLRFFIADDVLQHAAAKRLLKRCEAENEQLYVAVPVLCEVVWALRSRHDANRETCAGMIEDLLDNDLLVVEQAAAASRALLRFRKGQGDYSDYLIHELSSAASAKPLYTFDKALLKEAGFAKP